MDLRCSRFPTSPPLPRALAGRRKRERSSPRSRATFAPGLGGGAIGLPYIVVDGTQPKKAVTFEYWDESDGVDFETETSFPFYPIPDEAITQPSWIEGGPPGNQAPGGEWDKVLIMGKQIAADDAMRPASAATLRVVANCLITLPLKASSTSTALPMLVSPGVAASSATLS